ncbi:MAG: hypothetical protein IKV38_01920 [Clostridia bacterium]|nr:hypothetical protein [Clostridia bacterium]
MQIPPRQHMDLSQSGLISFATIGVCVLVRQLRLAHFLFCGVSMKYDKEQLEQINIHALRNIAREVGVRAPTRLNKNVVIKEIMQIESGQKQPYQATRKGRHAKDFVINDQIKNPTISVGVETKESLTSDEREKLKKEFISVFLKEVEKKLNEIL